MIEVIKNEREISPYITRILSDAGISVSVDSMLAEDDFIAIKVDNFYNDKVHPSPKSVDFVVIVDCSCNCYALYILEFKNVGSPNGLIVKDIQDKFTTTIEDFIKKRYNNIFLNDRYKYKLIKLYLVSDAYGISGKYSTHLEYRTVIEKIYGKDTLKVDQSLSQKLYKIKNHIVHIEYDIPPNPIIKKAL